jgi:hypothetical protein
MVVVEAKKASVHVCNNRNSNRNISTLLVSDKLACVCHYCNTNCYLCMLISSTSSYIDIAIEPGPIERSVSA